MERIGFIREKRDIKFLILYAMRYLPLPAPEDTILEICLIDDAFGYLEFAEAFAELLETGHIEAVTEKDGKRFSVTNKGREASAVFEGQLPATVREKAMHAAMRAIYKMRRDQSIDVDTAEASDGFYHIRLRLGDRETPILRMELAAQNESQCALIEKNFRKNAEKIYGAVLYALMQEHKESETR